MALKKKDWVEIEYSGSLKESGELFDTTDEAEAKKAQIYTEDSEYAPIVICLGESHILKGIDEFLEGKEPGEYTLELPAEKAFGKKQASLIKMVPASQFKNQKVRPVPGLRLNIDGHVGIVKTVGGGRCVVDFNHPLASQDVEYKLKVNKIVTDAKVQIESLLRILLAVKADVKVEDKKATISFPSELPEKLATELAKKIKELTGVDTSFEVKK